MVGEIMGRADECRLMGSMRSTMLQTDPDREMPNVARRAAGARVQSAEHGPSR